MVRTWCLQWYNTTVRLPGTNLATLPAPPTANTPLYVLPSTDADVRRVDRVLTFMDASVAAPTTERDGKKKKKKHSDAYGEAEDTRVKKKKKKERGAADGTGETKKKKKK